TCPARSTCAPRCSASTSSGPCPWASSTAWSRSRSPRRRPVSRRARGTPRASAWSPGTPSPAARRRSWGSSRTTSPSAEPQVGWLLTRRTHLRALRAAVLRGRPALLLLRRGRLLLRGLLLLRLLGRDPLLRLRVPLPAVLDDRLLGVLALLPGVVA